MWNYLRNRCAGLEPDRHRTYAFSSNDQRGTGSLLTVSKSHAEAVRRSSRRNKFQIQYGPFDPIQNCGFTQSEQPVNKTLQRTNIAVHDLQSRWQAKGGNCVPPAAFSYKN